MLDKIPASLGAAAGAVAAAVVVLGAGFAVDDRYAHAGDVKQLSVQVEVVSLEARRAQLEDKVYDLAAKNQSKRLPPAEASSLARYTNELSDVTRQLRQKRQLIDQLKAGK